MRRQRRRPAYFSVFALYDGTVLFAKPTRRPSPKTLKQFLGAIDEDGVWCEYAESEKDVAEYNADAKRHAQLVAAAAINTRRAIRMLVGPRLAEIESRLSAVQLQLDRIEAAVGAIHTGRDPASPDVPDAAS